MFRTIGDLIAKAYTLEYDQFLELCPDPVFVGVGILDAAMFQQNDNRHSTLAIELGTQPGGQTPHHLMGVIFPIKSPDDPKWTRLALGRTDENDIVINDPAVSEFHAFVKRIGESIHLGDLGSTNGTKLNGKSIKPPQIHPLEDEDIITFGRCSFQFFTPKVLFEYLSLGFS